VIEIRSGRVLLRAFRPDEVDAVYAAHAASEAIVGPPSREKVRARVERSGAWDDGRLDLGVEAGGELIGSLDVRSGRMTIPPGVCEFGIELWAAHRGAGLGTEVVTVLTEWLHREGFPRVQASTAVDNARMRRVLEKAGYAFEGIMRSYMPHGDGRADYTLYAHVDPAHVEP
jgi:RimJ/RimL family protein N-acetyltransferase